MIKVSIYNFIQSKWSTYISTIKKVKLDRNNDPRTTFLYEYIGINEDEAPVYRLINKKGMSYRGNILIEMVEIDLFLNTTMLYQGL